MEETEEAEEAGRLLFDHAPFEEKTLRVPLTADSFAEAVYPFREFKVIQPKGENGTLSARQKMYWPYMKEFFDGMSQESRDFFRDSML